MEKLERNYLQNQITLEELKILRGKIDAVSDVEIAASMQCRWINDTIDERAVPVESLNKIKMAIDKSITPARPAVYYLYRFARIAAVILLPVLLLSTLYLYRENRTLAAEEMVVATGRGERANITLPDGTHVTVNSESSLRYAPQTFNKNERSIRMDGEAYFDVTKKVSLPFIVNTTDLRVEVLGTKFNLLAREPDAEVQLSLEEGHVSLLSFLSKDKKEAFAGQQAVLDKATGVITIHSPADIKTNALWRRGELTFCNAKLADVVSALEKNYNITIAMPARLETSGDLFTGVVPANNLLEALEILKLSYHLNYTLLEHKVAFVRE